MFSSAHDLRTGTIVYIVNYNLQMKKGRPREIRQPE